MNDLDYPSTLYKILDFEGGKSMLTEETLWFTRACKLNDAFDCYHQSPVEADYGQFQVEFDFNAVFKYIGICSLSSNSLNDLMWSYYNKHEGVCLGVDMDLIGKKLIGYHEKVERAVFIKKVTYQDKPPVLNPIEIVPRNFQEVTGDDIFDDAQKAINTFLSTKSKNWEHEEEYRLILREKFNASEEPAIVSIENLISSIYLGCKLKPEKKGEIIDIARRKSIKIYDVHLNESGYGLKTSEL